MSGFSRTSSSQTGRSRVAGALTIAALVALIVALQVVRERRFATSAAGDEFLYLTSPAVATRLALSYDAVLADLYWMRAIQYFGGNRLARDGNKRYPLLYPLLDLTTSLDPHFSIAYRFGAFFLSEPMPGGAGRADLAVRLLEKGMQQDARRWEYPHDIGFVYYRDRDYRAAAQWFQRAGEVEGAPEWLQPLAAVTLAAGGDTASSRAVWRHLLESEADWLRQAAEFRLRQLDAIDQTAQLERLVADYARRTGRSAQSWEDIIRARMLGGIPVDPAGEPYVLDPATGEVSVSERSPMWPLPTERPA